jgi:integrase/recombinase XerD
VDPDAIERCGPEIRQRARPRSWLLGALDARDITTALENGAQLGDVQEAAAHRDPGTTKLYDRRGYKPEKAASFFATY